MIGSARAAIGTIVIILALTPAVAAGEVATSAASTAPRSIGAAGPAAGCDVVVPQDQESKPRARRGVLGWLYKYTRNIDVERAGSPRLPGFLRSPLLGALPGRSDADCERDTPAFDGVVRCAVISVNPGSDEAIIFTAPMPQLGETTLGGIEEQVRERLSRGEKVALETSKGGLIRIRSDAGYVSARACRTDA